MSEMLGNFCNSRRMKYNLTLFTDVVRKMRFRHVDETVSSERVHSDIRFVDAGVIVRLIAIPVGPDGFP